MKPTFSIGEALAAPFRLARRRPVSLFLWGVIMTGIMVALYGMLVPAFANVPIGAGRAREAMVEYIHQSQMAAVWINAMTPLMYLAMLLVWTAAARATLSPGKGDRLAFLRVGMDEVRVAVVYVAWFLLWYVSLIVLVMIGFALGLTIWFIDQTIAIVVGVVFGLGVAIVGTWLWLRLSLIAPATLILKAFAFAEGWALTRGQVWKLLGLNLLKWVISIPLTLGLYALVAAILAGAFFGQGLTWPADAQTVADLQPLFRAMLPAGAVALIPVAGFYGFYLAFSAAPSIVAARQLLDGVPVPPAPIVADAASGDGLEPA
ncbi:hypothetical protein MMB232_02518 [Brevundimonas subvibrioides]|uniref:hypothetical protein n=1 Tax=Brevundimonas subvibrioides TaxID=74313 RepID=UPI0032D5AE71